MDLRSGRVVTLSLGGTRRKVWRKQILPLGSINYEGRKIHFDSAYHRDLVRSFRAGAYDQVPFQLADGDNNHNNDPARTKGEMLDLRAEKDGLYGYFEVGDPSLLLGNKKLGVSCRILENYTREHDGRKFPRALQHVLGTLDPRVTGMKPWESVELSSGPVDSTLDLSTSFYTKDGGEMPDDVEDKQVVELSTAQRARLEELLAQDQADQELIDSLDPDELDPTDDEEDPESEADGEEDGGDESIALAQVADLQGQILELTNKLDGRDAQYEMEQLAATGLAPSILECAQPLLAMQAGVVELSNGKRTSPAAQTRKLLRSILELSNKGIALVNFDTEIGRLTGDDSVQATREAQLNELDRMYGK